MHCLHIFILCCVVQLRKIQICWKLCSKGLENNIMRKQIIQPVQVKAKQANGTCHKLYIQLNILLLQSQYIFSLLLVIIKNRDQLLSSLEVRGINTRYNSNLHLPLAKLTLYKYQKGVFYAGSRIYNYLPSITKDLSNVGKRFKTAVKRYLLDNSFYSLELYFNQNLP